jgi:hypothetical protein
MDHRYLIDNVSDIKSFYRILENIEKITLFSYDTKTHILFVRSSEDVEELIRFAAKLAKASFRTKI